ncbi:MAG: lamin tail domain-containing protein [Chitinophagaceae bacterium]|nr:lamin tail domain-containing protein [Chitinophagaceae bacterium]
MKTLILLSFLLTPVCMLSQNRYDIVIDEIMADPTPQVGLPANEWIELKNSSSVAINLQNWRIGDATGQSGPMPNFTLQPDSFVIVCTGSAAAAMSAYGTTIAVTSFPSLDNDGDQLFLKTAAGRTIHAVAYTSGWYNNEVKRWWLDIGND